MQADRVAVIKAAIAKGAVVLADRKAGKTRALLEYAHDNGPERFVVLVHLMDLVKCLYMSYRVTYGEGVHCPEIFYGRKAMLEGDDRMILVDEYFLCGSPGKFFAAVATLPENFVTIR